MSTWLRHRNVTLLGLVNLTWAILLCTLVALSVASRASRVLRCPLFVLLLMIVEVSVVLEVSLEVASSLVGALLLKYSRLLGLEKIGLLLHSAGRLAGRVELVVRTPRLVERAS